MKRKPIKVDWDALEAAFSRPHDDLDSHLDLVTGHVVLAGEGEEGDEDDDVVALPQPAAAEPDDSTRLSLHPPGTAVKLVWMDEFLRVNGDRFGDAPAGVREAMDADDPAAAIGAVLNGHTELRDAWYLYRADRIHERIERWLDENGVVVADPPPWE